MVMFAENFFSDFGKTMFTKSGIQVPRIVLNMAAKFEMWPKEMITLDQIFDENQVVNKFLSQSVWKDHIVSDSSISPNTDLGKSTTHWWKRFQSTSVIPPSTPKPAIMTTTSTDTLPASRLPSTGIQLVGLRCQLSGIKRPSPQYPHDDGDGRDKGTAKITTGKDNAGEATRTRETKQCKVSLSIPPERGEMVFSPVSHTYIFYHTCSN
jgi:hypothetical protein